MSGARWIICPRCNGDGKHSHHLGAFTASEWDGEDGEFHEAYMRGDYDRTCERCEGTGKVRAHLSVCGVCGEPLPNQEDEYSCCGTDSFPEPAEIRETGR